MYQIEKISVAPVRPDRTLSVEDFPFGSLEVEESFFVPNHESGRARAVPFKAAKAAYPDRRFRRVPEADGVRYGRIA